MLLTDDRARGGQDGTDGADHGRGSETPVLELADLRRSFAGGAILAVAGVSLALRPGEILSILGPSGCGKTTVMRVIAGLDAPDSGDIRIRGRSVLGVPPHRRNIGLVFQSLAVFPHMTVGRNIAFGLRMAGVSRREQAARIERILRLVQLPPETFADRMPAALSGGQLQRVALARTLVTEPSVVLFDEPMAALDRRLRDYMAVELRAIQKRLGVAAIYVTHDQETASMMSDRIAIMEAGRIVQIGTPAAVYERPANRFVADFLGDVNCLRGQVQAIEDAVARISCGNHVFEVPAEGFAAGEKVTLMLRPEHIRLSAITAEGAFARGTVAAAHFVSGAYRCRLRLDDGQELTVQGAAEVGREGEAFWLHAEARFLRTLRE